MNCKHCNNPIPPHKKQNIFCNSSCSAKYNNRKKLPRTEESKIKTAKSVCKYLGIDYTPRKKPKENPLIKAAVNKLPHTKIRQCTYCTKFFDHGLRNSTTCSDECFIAVKVKLNMKGKKYYHNNIELDSSWEKKIACFLDDRDIKWIRPKPLGWIDQKGKKRKYFPDFYLPEHNLYLDPKNPLVRKKQQEKVNYFLSNYSNIIIDTYDNIMAYLKGLEPSCAPVTLSTGS